MKKIKPIEQTIITYREIVMFAFGLVFATAFILAVIWFKENYIFDPHIIKPRITSPIPSKTSPVIHPSVTPRPTTVPKKKAQTKADIVASSKYPKFIAHIWERESGNGTAKVGLNTYCSAKGMSNEFGFYPSGKHCFTSFEAGVARLEKWYEDNSGLTDNQKLCRYNSGTASNTCAYLGYNFSEMN